MTEAIEILRRLHEVIKAEIWHNEEAKRYTLEGIKLSIAKLHHEASK